MPIECAEIAPRRSREEGKVEEEEPAKKRRLTVAADEKAYRFSESVFAAMTKSLR